MKWIINCHIYQILLDLKFHLFFLNFSEARAILNNCIIRSFALPNTRTMDLQWQPYFPFWQFLLHPLKTMAGPILVPVVSQESFFKLMNFLEQSTYSLHRLQIALKADIEGMSP